MPSKGQKVAKRQNQMKSRKRRGPRRSSSQQFEVGPAISKSQVEDEEGAAAAPATATATMPAATTAPTRRRRAKQAAEEEAPPVTRFLPGELRHIGLVTLVILIILAAATVTLGGSII
ncbi:MAG: hypothetical protein OXD46_15490 [Chloroflexi bacterium]|nr:hypothetical protein [Chloroflexota bacterium]